MKETFDKIVRFVLEHEGGYVKDPHDPGGDTKYGISRRAYPNEDIRNLPKERAVQIYREDYWGKLGCDSLEWPLDAVAFDTAINLGVARAKFFLQHYPSWVDYLFARLRFYTELKGWARFGRGWVNRVADLYQWVLVEQAMMEAQKCKKQSSN